MCDFRELLNQIVGKTVSRTIMVPNPDTMEIQDFAIQFTDDTEIRVSTNGYINSGRADGLTTVGLLKAGHEIVDGVKYWEDLWAKESTSRTSQWSDWRNENLFVNTGMEKENISNNTQEASSSPTAGSAESVEQMCNIKLVESIARNPLALQELWDLCKKHDIRYHL